MMGFEGFSSWSLDILCGQSIPISRVIFEGEAGEIPSGGARLLTEPGHVVGPKIF
jgi:hypothetical protein